MSRGVGYLCGICFTIAGCQRDSESVTKSSASALAVGAFHRVVVADACPSGGKGNFCTSESVTDIENITVDDPRVAALRSIETVPSSLRADGVAWVVEALASGSTTIRFAARFDDGSSRPSEFAVEAMTASRAEEEVICTALGAEDRTLFPPGAEAYINLRLFRKNTRLVGLVPNLVTGPGLTQLPGVLEGNSFSWEAPNAPRTVSLGSERIAAYSLSLRTYSPDEVEVEELELRTPSPLARDTPVTLRARMTVGGKVPCVTLPLQATTLTPETCVGPNSELEWQGVAEGALITLPLASGTCGLSVAPVGSDAFRKLEVPLELAPP